MRKKQEIILNDITIESVAAEGKALAHVDGTVVFVQFAVPGDIVDIKITKKKKNYMEGYILALKKPSEHRLEPFCKYFGICGGCKWQPLPYPMQLQAKQQQVYDQLVRIGHLQVPEIQPIIGSEKITNYRNKLEFTFSERRWIYENEDPDALSPAQRLGLGFHVGRFFDKVLDIDCCHLQPSPSNEIRNFIRQYAIDNGLSFFDWHIAQIGGFNYVANELFSRTHSDVNSRCNFYTVDEPNNPSFKTFIDDITHGKGKNDWIIVIAGEQIVKNSPYDFHFELGGDCGETSFDFDECIPWNRSLTKQLYEDFSKTLEETIQLKTDLHGVQPKVGAKNLVRHLTTQTEANVLLLTISYDLMVFKRNVYEAILNVANVLNRNLETRKPIGLHLSEYSVRPIESQYWRKLYLTED